MDPDKKVEKLKKEKKNIYQSSQHPEPFENEGSEFEAETSLKEQKESAKKAGTTRSGK
jgi:hypothetical protein